MIDITARTEKEYNIKLLNKIILFGITAVSIMGLVLAINQKWSNLFMNLGVLSVLIVILVLNKYGKFMFGLMVFYVLLPAAILIMVYFYGNTGVHHYFYALIATHVYFFQANKILRIALVVYCVLLFFIALYFLYSIWNIHDPDGHTLRYYLNLILPVLLIFVANMYFQHYKDEEKKNVELVSETRGKLISVISHDLRNPVKSLELLSSSAIRSKFDEGEYDKLMVMLTNQLKLTSLSLENTLVWVKKQMDGMKYDDEWFSLKAIIDGNIALMSDMIQRKELTVKVNVPSDVEIKGDVEIVNIIIRNLLSNAIKHSYPKLGVISFDFTKEKGLYWVSVIDNGQGIDALILKTIFSEIQATTGTENEKGYGIGLKLVKGFLDSMNEKLKVESELKKGTTFSFSVHKKKCKTSTAAN